jgi:fibronectin type 3 domain-containing protein
MTLLLACCLFFLPSACRSKPHHVDLSWKAPAGSPVPIVGYNIYRSPDGGSSYHRLNPIPVQGTTYKDYMLQQGRTYRYIIRSVDNHGVESSPSNLIDVTIPE